MKNIKSFLKIIDGFGVPYLFKYKAKEKYKTSIGGLFLILYIILVITIVIYFFIPFVKRKNYTFLFYTSNIKNPELINLKKSNSPFLLGLICENSNNLNIKNLFEIEANFISQLNYYGSKNRQTININTHICTSNDVNNIPKELSNSLSLSNYYCLNDNYYGIEGDYNSEKYSYYEFSVKSKNNSTENINNINSFLNQNECRFQFIFSDISLNLDNYNNPMVYQLKSLDIQLNRNLLITKNIFFMNQYLINDDNVFGGFDENKKQENKGTFSRQEQYFYYVGKNRNEDISDNNLIYAKFILKADNRKRNIKRRYQKFIEFYADVSSILLLIYFLLSIFCHYINNFYSELSLSKKIFIFKGLYNKHIDINKKILKIQQLYSLTNKVLSKKNSFNSGEIIEKNNNKDNKNIKVVDCNNIYQVNNLNFESLNKSLAISGFDFTDRESNIFNRDKKEYDGKKTNLKTYNYKNNDSINKINSKSKLRFFGEYQKNCPPKSKELNKEKSNIKNNSDKDLLPDKLSNPRITENKIKKRRKIKFSFNILEIIRSKIFKTCLSQNLETKLDFFNKSKELLYNKMDIVLYVRNALLLDIIVDLILDSDKKCLINLLSRPVISAKEKEENDFQGFYKNYEETDFIRYSFGMHKLIRQNDKKNDEQKLIELCNKQLKELL